MKTEVKLMLRAIPFGIIAYIFFVWAMFDFAYVFIFLPILMFFLIYIMPALVLGTILLVMMIIYATARKKNTLFNEKTVYYCRECGTEVKLEEKSCKSCGAENIHRTEALEKLNEMEKSLEDSRVKILEKHLTKKWRTSGTGNLERDNLDLIYSQSKDVKSKKVSLIVGDTEEEKIKWAKAQFYEENRSLQEIADDLGESMITVKKYINSEE